MKSSKLFSLFIIIAGVFGLYACKSKSDPAPDGTAVQLAKLSKTWKVVDAKLNGVSQSGYSNFLLTLSGVSGASSFSYSTSGRPDNNPWMNTGSWAFGAPPETAIIRDKGTANEIPMTYTVTETQLEITFTFAGSGFPGGRISNIEGQWVFIFSPV